MGFLWRLMQFYEIRSVFPLHTAKAFNVVAFKLDFLGSTVIRPAKENNLSDGMLLTGAANKIRATCDILGKAVCFSQNMKISLVVSFWGGIVIQARSSSIYVPLQWGHFAARPSHRRCPNTPRRSGCLTECLWLGKGFFQLE